MMEKNMFFLALPSIEEVFVAAEKTFAILQPVDIMSPEQL